MTNEQVAIVNEQMTTTDERQQMTNEQVAIAMSFVVCLLSFVVRRFCCLPTTDAAPAGDRRQMLSFVVSRLLSVVFVVCHPQRPQLSFVVSCLSFVVCVHSSGLGRLWVIYVGFGAS